MSASRDEGETSVQWLETTAESDLEPGACHGESVLNAAEPFDELAAGGEITEIRSEIHGTPPADSDRDAADIEQLSSSVSGSSLQEAEGGEASEAEAEGAGAPDLTGKQKHVFILSSAGKPIYSRYGKEDKLAGLCGVIQALVSVVEEQGQDALRSLHTAGCRAVFLVKGPLILVVVSKTNESEAQLTMQLTYAFNQIVSVLTLTQLNRIFEQRRNYDLRRLLAGAERLIDHLIVFMEKDPAFLLGAVRCLPLPLNARENITSAIISACSKIRDLVFAILIAGNQLITLVRMKKYTLHPADIHLLFNLVRSSESFKTAESWTPICLPKFDATGFLHGHVSYISEDCQACLLLLTVQRDAFFPLSKAKHSIAERMRRNNCLAAINDALTRSPDLPTADPLRHIGVPEMRHFMYKCKSTAQLFTSDPVSLERPSDVRRRRADGDAASETQADSARPRTMSDMDYLHNYRTFCDRVHCAARPAKLIFRSNSDETILTWVTNGFELYVTMDPLVDKNAAILAVDRLLRWIKKEEDRIFIMNAPTF